MKPSRILKSSAPSGPLAGALTDSAPWQDPDVRDLVESALSVRTSDDEQDQACPSSFEVASAAGTRCTLEVEFAGARR